jgi:hypothetical protein
MAPLTGCLLGTGNASKSSQGNYLLKNRECSRRFCALKNRECSHRDTWQEKSLEALILIQAAAGWQGLACQLCHALIRGLSFTGVAQEAHVTGLIAHEEVFEGVTRLLATVIFLLVLGIFRAVEGSFGTIMKQREVVGPASVRFAASSVAKSSAVRAGSHSWCASA